MEILLQVTSLYFTHLPVKLKINKFVHFIALKWSRIIGYTGNLLP